jgi:uncharacterized membrane protein (DUF2068 family)
MRQLKSFNVIQTATTMAAVYAVLGAIAGVLFFLGGLASGRFLAAVSALILMPLAYGLGGFILTAIACFAYNEVAKHVGGIEIEIS